MSCQIYQETSKQLEEKLKNLAEFSDEQIKGKGFDPLSYRLFLMENLDKDNLDFTWENLETSQNRLFDLKRKIAMIADFEYGGTKENYKHFISNYKRTETNLWEKVYQKRLELIEILEQNKPNTILNFINLYEKNIGEIYQQIYDLALINTIESISQALEISYWYFNGWDVGIICFLDQNILKLNLSSDSLYSEISDELYQIEHYQRLGYWQESEKIKLQLKKKGYQIDDYPWGFGVWWRGN